MNFQLEFNEKHDTKRKAQKAYLHKRCCHIFLGNFDKDHHAIYRASPKLKPKKVNVDKLKYVVAAKISKQKHKV